MPIREIIRQFTPRAALLTCVLGAVLTGRAGAQGRISVGKNVFVSASSPGWMHAEYTADADPTNAGRVMVCGMRHSQARNQLTSVIYISNDSGRNWSLSLEDSVSRFHGVWDPACKFGLDNQAFFITLILPDTARRDSVSYSNHQWWRMGGNSNMHLHRSTDAGKSWEPSRDLSFIDYETITIDRTNSPYRGRMYIYGNTFGRGVWLVYSTDSGKTWERSERNDEDDGWPRDGTVLPSGTLLLPFNKKSTRNATPQQPQQPSLTVGASRDGGVHILPSVNIATVGGCPNEAQGFGMASDHSNGLFRGRAYIIWPDARDGRCVPLVSWSDDEGKTWSKPVLVGDARSRPPGFKPKEHALTKIAVNRDGVVGATWYDAGDDTTTSHLNLRFSASLDGGESWLPSVKVSDYGYVVKNPPEMAAHTVVDGGGVRTARTPSDEVGVRVLVSARSYYQGNGNPGDYTGMAAGADGAFHTFWIDNRSGNGEMYSARVSVEGTVVKPDAALASLKNITPAIELQYTSSVWDPRSTTITWEYQLLNTSKDTIVGPLKMRITALTSPLGAPTLMLDGKPLGGRGTIIDISNAVPSGGLLPGQTSASKKLQLKLDQIHDYQNFSLANMSVKVYGIRHGAPADSTKKTEGHEQ